MKIYTKLVLTLISIGLVYSCFEDRDDTGVFASTINDFIWKGMNAVYLYKSNIPDLANDRFATDESYAEYLNSFGIPEDLFESLIHQRQTVDKYSWIVDDYIALEQFLDGISTTNGMEFGLRHIPGSNSSLFGYVRYILPGSDAESKGVQRGDIFTEVDGTGLTEDNYSSLLFSGDMYSIALADYDNNGTPQTDDDIVTENGNTVSLTKFNLSENPVFHSSIIDQGGEKIGYLMYNGFTSDYNSQLNNVFGDFAANGVQHLVLDLRYNPGGSVNTASLLGSMITGQFNGQVFTKLNYNDDLQNLNTTFDFTTMFDGNPINSLGLDKVYVLATGSSASASEMVINSLKTYIDVVQIGSTTEGKSQASVTIYDSPDFGRNGANPNHTYAMQPLVAISVNSNDGQVPSGGLVPDIALGEDVSNLGIIGEENEPLLAKALDEIGMTNAPFYYVAPVHLVGDSNDAHRFGKEMYLDDPAPGLVHIKFEDKH